MDDDGFPHWKISFRKDFISLTADTEHLLDVEIEFELAAGAQPDAYRHLEVSVVQRPPGPEGGCPPSSGGDPLRTMGLPVALTGSIADGWSGRACGTLSIRPRCRRSQLTALWIVVSANDSAARRPPAVELLVGILGIKPADETRVLGQLARDDQLLRLPPTWNPISVGVSSPKFTNIVPRVLVPAATDDPPPALAPRLIEELERLLEQRLHKVAEDQGGPLSVSVYRPEKPEVDPFDPTPDERNRMIDYYLNGEDDKPTGMVAYELVERMARRGVIYQLGEVEGEGTEVHVAAFMTDVFAAWLAEADLNSDGETQVGIPVFGLDGPEGLMKRAVVDLSRLWSPDLPDDVALTRQELRDLSRARSLVAPYFGQSGVSPDAPAPPERQDAAMVPPIVAAADTLAASAQVLPGWFVASDGRLLKRWLSLPESEAHLTDSDEGEGAEIVRRGCSAFLDGMHRQVDRFNEQTTATRRRLVVLNLCSPGSGISDDFNILHDRQTWDPHGYVGTVSLHHDDVVIKEDDIADALEGSDATLVVVLVPIDSYAWHLAQVVEYVRRRHNNVMAMVVALFMLALGDHSSEQFAGAPVIPLVRVGVDERDGGVVPASKLDDIVTLYPWIVQACDSADEDADSGIESEEGKS